jgi:hypothetical protein
MRVEAPTSYELTVLEQTKFNVLTDHHNVFENQEETGHTYMINSSDFMFIFKNKDFRI